MKPAEAAAGSKKARIRARAAPHPMAMAFTIKDAQAMGAPGRTTIYKLAKRGELRLLHVAGRTLVAGDSLRALLRFGDLTTPDGDTDQGQASGNADKTRKAGK